MIFLPHPKTLAYREYCGVMRLRGYARRLLEYVSNRYELPPLTFNLINDILEEPPDFRYWYHWHVHTYDNRYAKYKHRLNLLIGLLMREPPELGVLSERDWVEVNMMDIDHHSAFGFYEPRRREFLGLPYGLEDSLPVEEGDIVVNRINLTEGIMYRRAYWTMADGMLREVQVQEARSWIGGVLFPQDTYILLPPVSLRQRMMSNPIERMTGASEASFNQFYFSAPAVLLDALERDLNEASSPVLELLEIAMNDPDVIVELDGEELLDEEELPENALLRNMGAGGEHPPGELPFKPDIDDGDNYEKLIADIDRLVEERDNES